MYHELAWEIDMLQKEERREDEVQDPPEMTVSLEWEDPAEKQGPKWQ